jgi:hypothetical protein
MEKLVARLNAPVERLVRAAVGAAMTVVAKEARAQINASGASPEVKRDARALIGKRFVGKGDKARAKVGFAVGMNKKKREAARARNIAKYGGQGFVSANSIHLFVLGTAERFQKKSGQSTGRMAPQLDRVIAAAAANSASPALAAAAEKARQILEAGH